MSIKPAASPLDIAAPALRLTDHASALHSDLPSPDTKRWVIRRKAAVVAAVRAGILSLEQACERYKLSSEEFLNWQKLVDDHGLPGLRVTRLHAYRQIGS
jgi:Protein of unknown function (DUF1153)